MAGAPSRGRVRGWVGSAVQPHWVPAVIAILLPDALHRYGYKGIENSNPMVTERHITRITVSRQEPLGQVTGQAGDVQNRESAGDVKSRKTPKLWTVVSVRNGALTAGVLVL
jgi:hypothetical protein